MKRQQDITKLGFYLNRAFSGIVDEFDHALRESGLPLNHARFLILKALEKNKEKSMSQRAIALQLGKDPAAISRTLKILESDGLIERRAANGCKNEVILTEKYIYLRPRIEEVIKSVTTEYCTGLTEKEITGGLTFLQRILEKRIGNK